MPKKKGGKKGKAKSVEEPEPEPQAAATDWICPECEQENEGTDEVCIACEEPRPAAPEPEVDDRYAGYRVGVIVAAEPVPGNDKLSAIEVNIGDEEPVKDRG